MEYPMTCTQVTKRDGSLAPFDALKISQAIAAAGQATGELDTPEAARLAARVVGRLTGLTCPGIETIQNDVEDTLVGAGYWRTARAYIVYREQHARLRALKHTLVDVESTMDEYLEQRDWRVNANANQGYSLGGLILNVAGKVTANYWLSHVYSPEAGRAHREGDLHIHDLDMLSGYCAGWSLRQLLTEGFNGVPGKVDKNFKLVLVDGREASRTLVSETVSVQPVTEKVAVGTKEKPKAEAAGANTGAAAPGMMNEAMWDKIAQCESTGNWSINSGNGYYGGLQFDIQTWIGAGGGAYAPNASLATKAQQIDIANRIYAQRGLSPWGCGWAASS